MQALRRPDAFHTAIAAACLALSLTACANGPATPQAPQVATSVTHLCKPQETVGFSCELHDHQLLSLCASPGFLQFQGASKDNPGYAYVAIGQQGQRQSKYPADPKDYKKYMTFSMSLAGATPYLFVKTDKGGFLDFSLDIEEPVAADPSNAPSNWPLNDLKAQPLCTSHVYLDHLDPFMAQMVDDPEWTKNRGSSR